MYKWKITQDKLIVARGIAPDKERALQEMGRYLWQYCEEDFAKTTAVIEKEEK